jgi:hypothetical protein
MFHGLDVTGLAPTNPAMTWKDLDRLRKLVSGKLLIKGIETREDTEACLNAGVDGIIVSNHGGRAEESGRGTLDCLPDVVEAASGRVRLPWAHVPSVSAGHMSGVWQRSASPVWNACSTFCVGNSS